MMVKSRLEDAGDPGLPCGAMVHTLTSGELLFPRLLHLLHLNITITTTIITMVAVTHLKSWAGQGPSRDTSKLHRESSNQCMTSYKMNCSENWIAGTGVRGLKVSPLPPGRGRGSKKSLRQRRVELVSGLRLD